MNKGDIVLVPFPFTDLSGNKVRPALVLAVVGDDVIVAFISSKWNIRENNTSIFVKADFLNRLKADSAVRCSKIATLDRKIIVGTIGIIKTPKIKEINIMIKKILHLSSLS